MASNGYEHVRENENCDESVQYPDNNNNNTDNNFPGIPTKCIHILNIRFRCISCRETLCTECLLQFHRSCHYVPEQSYIRNLCLRKGKELKQILGSRLKELNRLEKTFSEECSSIKTIIEDRSQALISSIMIEKKILADKLSLIKMIKINSYKNQVKECREALKEVYRMEENNYTYKSFSSLNRKVSSLLNEVEKMELLKETKISIPQNDGTSLGQIKISASARNSTLEICGNVSQNTLNTCVITVKNDLGETNNIDEHYTLCVRIVDDNDNPIFVLLENLKNGSYNIKFFPTILGKHILYASVDSVPIFSSPKEIIVSEGSTALAKPELLFGKEGEKEGEFARPWGICCDNHGRIFIADRCNHRIQVFTENGDFLYKFGKEGLGRGELNRPTGITLDIFQRVIVADKDNHRIQIFDTDGAYITHFGKFENAEDNLNYPWDVAVTSNCQIAVTETKERRVRLFTDTGIELLRFDFTTTMDLELPRGITVLPNGCFLITDFNKHKLLLLNERFEQPKVLGCEGIQPQEFFRPQSVACYRNGLFAVSDCKNHRIQIFKNNIIYKLIGRKGSEPGEFDAPQGITFHPDGRLIVVDFGNSRVQIFDIS